MFGGVTALRRLPDRGASQCGTAPVKRVFLGLFGLAAGAVALLLAAPYAGSWLKPALPVLGQVPPFQLVASGGVSVSEKDLAGRLWVADFIFTSCQGMCPVLTAQFARLVNSTDDPELRFVSFSVDPARDTPAVLHAYAFDHGADPRRWIFLTGPREALYDLISRGFHLSVREREKSDTAAAAELITHSDRFVLVDRRLRIRGYYHGMEQESVGQVLADIERLRSEG